MNELFTWIIYLGVFGVGLMVLLWGLQFLIAIGILLIAAIAALWQWAVKQFKGGGSK